MFFPSLPLRPATIQTILPTIWPTKPYPADYWAHVKVDDFDQVLVGVNAPQGQPKALVITVHGLTGSAESSYNLRLARKLNREGYLVCRMNLRNCGVGAGKAKKTYHAGQSRDLAAVVDYAHSSFPDLPIYLVGFSLGANLMLKYLGEGQGQSSSSCRGFVAVSPPFDLMASARHLKSKHHLWDRYFVKLLIAAAKEHHHRFTELGELKFPSNCSLVDFDDLYTAPRHGFGTVSNYYHSSSCGQFLKDIPTPGVIVGSHDDPIVYYGSVPQLNASTSLVLSPYGGHCGFVGESMGQRFFWLDDFILNCLENRGNAQRQNQFS